MRNIGLIHIDTLFQVERCTLLPNTPMRVVHYATATLNQITFDRKKEADRRVAHRLVDFYFTLFKMILDGHIGFRIDMEKKVRHGLNPIVITVSTISSFPLPLLSMCLITNIGYGSIYTEIE